ncbi:COP9 signalosome complex subunit 8-like [Trifolium medium]|uniref:COP9 signalosome complex subunit 8-like n=1 Tax=Trifolium medium TaxID=97028 RepID=A0A392PDK7_9FABA|nr:COP9 signalosome complex subunit 8-like [Trifolium medium]
MGNSARFLWKTIPSSIKESNPEVNAVWKIGQQLWLRNYGGVHEAIRGFEWSQGLQDFVAAFSGKHLRFCFVFYQSCESSVGRKLLDLHA